VPVGYGYRSIEYIIETCIKVESADPIDRAAMLHQIDEIGVMATPTNSAYNEQVIEAARESIADGGRLVRFG
jgi:D-galacturonate reductase